MTFNKPPRFSVKATVFVLFYLTAAGLYSQASDWFLNKPIRQITFDGLRNVKYADLEGYIDPFVGKNFTYDLYNELLGRLLGSEYFEKVEPSTVPSDPSGNGVILKLKVTERPIVVRVDFIGNSGLKASELRELLGTKPNAVYNAARVAIDEQAITTHYIEKGYPDAKITSSTRSGRDGQITIVFNIKEGEKVTLIAIHFEGNRQFSSKALTNQMKLSTKGILKDGAFQEEALLADRRAITQYYHDRGYIDSEVQDVVRESGRDSNGVTLSLTFKIYEGRLYKFEGVTFEGNKIFSTEVLQKLIRSKRGAVINERLIQSDLMRVSDLYYENGYIYNTITPSEQRDMNYGTIIYNVAIVERGRAFVEHVIVRGNKKTKDFVITREIPLEPGDIFSKTKVINGYRNLVNLQYFSSVVPDTPQGSTDGLLDLVVTVEEAPTTDVQLGVTFSGTSDPNAFPVSAMFKFTDRNFRGLGNTFGTDVNISPDIQSASVNYNQRWLLGLPLTGGFDITIQHARRIGLMDNKSPYFSGDEEYAYPDGFASYEDYVNHSKVPDDEYLMRYHQYSVSLGFSTGYRWQTPFGVLGTGGGLRLGFKYNDYDRTIYRPFDKTIRERDSLTPATSISFSGSLDERDIYFDPSQGYYINQRLGFYGLLPFELGEGKNGPRWEEEYYIRSDTKAEIFFTLWNLPVGEKWAFRGVLGLHTGVTLLLPGFAQRPESAGNPIVEQANQLSLDGMFTARGWQNERTVRGYALWENWAELRLPIVPGMLALDGIFDAAEIAAGPGALFGTDARGRWTERMRFSFGGGLRFAIPQFPFRFLFVKRFSFRDGGRFKWEDGAIGRGDPGSGIDFVLSFNISTY